MKKSITILTALMLAACSRPVEQDRSRTIEVCVPSETKVHIDGLKTFWDKGDAVTVFYKSETAESWTFKGKTGDVSGLIGPDDTSYHYQESECDIFILYPQDSCASLHNNVISTVIPSQQQYRADSYGTAVLASRSTSDMADLKYCTAIMRLDYQGPAGISRIVMNGNDGEKISGESIITYEGTEPVLTCNGNGAVNMDCDVIIEDFQARSFCFSIAPGTFSKGVTFTLYFKDGSEHTVTASEKITVEAGHIHTIRACSPQQSYTRKVMHLLFSDGTTRHNPFTTAMRFTCGEEMGPYLYQTEEEAYPFHMLCQTALASGTTPQHNFRITNGGGLYIGGTAGDYITFPAVDGFRLQDIAVSLNKDSNFHIAPADGAPDQTVAGGVCSDTESGDFRMLSLSGTEPGRSYRMYVDNICCFRSITLYYRKQQ